MWSTLDSFVHPPGLAEQAPRARTVDSGRQGRWRLPPSSFPMWIFDRMSGHIVAANEAAVRTYGYSRDELAALDAADICAFPASKTTDLRSGPARHTRKDGSSFVADLATVDTGDGTHVASLVIMEQEAAPLAIALEVPPSADIPPLGVMGTPRAKPLGPSGSPALALVDPRLLTENVCKRLRELADAKDVDIVVYSSCQRAWLRVGAFAEALHDLIANAVSASRRGYPVVVDIRETRDGDLIWQIQDAGNGLQTELDEPSAPSGIRLCGSRKTSGVSHARAIIADQGGELRFESALGVGTTASIFLPGRR